LAEALAGGDAGRAEQEASRALAVFEQLGSVQEADRARAALASHAART
jgi:hypothetical protein